MNLRHSFLSLLPLALVTALVGCGPTYLNPVPDEAAKDMRAALVKSGEVVGGAVEAVAETAMPTGFATFKGKFVLAGSAPQNPPLPVTKDHAVCFKGPGQEVVVGPGGGLANIVIYAEKVNEKWCHPDSKPGSATNEVTFDQKNCLFVPHVFACMVNQPVRLKNSDPVDHNTSLKAVKALPFDQTIPGGGSTIYKANKEEDTPFPVACAIHPWMSAYMIPRKDGYFAVTKADGTFEIPNLPAGVKLRFRVWQEKLKGALAVKLNDKEVVWKNGRFEATLEPDKELDYQVQMDAKLFGG